MNWPRNGFGQFDPLIDGDRLLPDYAPLPDYEVGGNVTAAKANDTFGSPIVSVKFSHQPGAIYNRGDFVTGSVIIRPRKTQKFNRVLVDMQMLQITRHSTSGHVIFTIPLTRYSIPEVAYPPSKMLHKGLQYEFTFSMTIPNTVDRQLFNGTTTPLMHFQLPPSVGCPTGDPDPTYDVADKSFAVCYRVRARLTSKSPGSSDFVAKRDIIDQSCKHFRVIPSYAPATVSKKIYKSSLQLKQGMFGGKSNKGMIEVTALNNLVLYSSDCQTTGDIDLNFTFIPSDKHLNAKLPDIKEITYKITAYTISSAKQLDHYPKPGAHKVHTCREIFRSGRFNGFVSKWRSKSSENRLSHDITIKLPVTIGNTVVQKFVPSFHSFFGSRQYEIVVSVEMDGLGHISLPVPVVVGRHRNPSTWVINDNSEIFDPVPTYSH